MKSPWTCPRLESALARFVPALKNAPAASEASEDGSENALAEQVGEEMPEVSDVSASVKNGNERNRTEQMITADRQGARSGDQIATAASVQVQAQMPLRRQGEPIATISAATRETSRTVRHGVQQDGSGGSAGRNSPEPLIRPSIRATRCSTRPMRVSSVRSQPPSHSDIDSDRRRTHRQDPGQFRAHARSVAGATKICGVAGVSPSGSRALSCRC